MLFLECAFRHMTFISYNINQLYGMSPIISWSLGLSWEGTTLRKTSRPSGFSAVSVSWFSSSLSFTGLILSSLFSPFSPFSPFFSALSFGQWGKCFATALRRSRTSAMPPASSGSWKRASTICVQPCATANSKGVCPQTDWKIPRRRMASMSWSDSIFLTGESHKLNVTRISIHDKQRKDDQRKCYHQHWGNDFHLNVPVSS